jgi:hypothetical protein
MGGTTLKTLGIVAVLGAGAIYINYGTLSPCTALSKLLYMPLKHTLSIPFTLLVSIGTQPNAD